MRTAHKRYQDFWQSLQGLEPVEVDGHHVLVLPEGVYLLGNPVSGSKMLLRTCYATMMSIMAQIKHEFGQREFLLTGNPGIGKTFGIVEVMRVAASRGVTVVLQLGAKNDARYLFRAGEPVLAGNGRKHDFDAYLEDEDVSYIVDGTNRPYEGAAWTLFVVPPTAELFWPYFKLYLPMWEKEEIDIARAEIHSSTPQSLVDERSARWGGIARYVLWPRATSREECLEAAINCIGWDECEKALKCSGTGNDFSHDVLHYVVDVNTLKVEQTTFGSPYIKYRLLHEEFRDRMGDIVKFAAFQQGGRFRRRVDDFIGAVYQEAVLQRLGSGGVFDTHCLEDDSVSTLQLEGVQERTLQTQEASAEMLASLPPNTLCILLRSNFEVADALLLPDKLFQPTGSDSPGISHAGLVKTLQLLPKQDQFNLYFCVPASRFNKFSKQPFLNETRKIIKQQQFLHPAAKKVRQPRSPRGYAGCCCKSGAPPGLNEFEVEEQSRNVEPSPCALKCCLSYVWVT